MEYVQLILFGFLTGLAFVTVNEARFSSLERGLLQIAVVTVAAFTLWLLRLSVVTNALDFIVADLGVVLGTHIEHLPGRWLRGRGRRLAPASALAARPWGAFESSVARSGRLRVSRPGHGP